MEESILVSVRTSLGILPGVTDFDEEIIIAINSAIFALSQIVEGLTSPFSISDDTALWTDLYGTLTNIESVKSYIILKTKLEFDPPGTSFLQQSYNNQVEELAYRLMIEVDPDLVP